MIITLHGDDTKPAAKKVKKDRDDLRLASIDDLLKTAAHVVNDVADTSVLFDSSEEQRIPAFSDREVSTGAIIGRGGFCVVRDIERIRTKESRRTSFTSSFSSRSVLTNEKNAGSVGSTRRRGVFSMCFGRSDEDSDSFSNVSLDSSRHSRSHTAGKLSVTNENQVSSRNMVAAKSKRSRSKGCRYVLKSVSKEIDKISFMKGHVDIAIEAKFLAVLNHPNIIKMAGVSKSESCTPGYFLILEKMTQTLTGRIKSWMDQERNNKSFLGAIAGGKKKEQQLYYDRIAASYDIASGLFYLHSKNIVYRDLKPDNVGFDRNGQLKLFDFGLAKELKEADKLEDGTYRNVTALTGAVRYMAPEVGRGKTYNLSVDVYSWAMVMWYILALEPPFGFYNEEMIRSRVHLRGSRPSIFRRWSEVLGEILKCSWDSNHNERPNFLEITLVLKQELIDCEAGGTVAGSAVGSEQERED